MSSRNIDLWINIVKKIEGQESVPSDDAPRTVTKVRAEIGLGASMCWELESAEP